VVLLVLACRDPFCFHLDDGAGTKNEGQCLSNWPQQRSEPASPHTKFSIRSYHRQHPMPAAPEIQHSHFERLLERSAALQTIPEASMDASSKRGQRTII
jgi:hypothetical protein